MVTLAALGVAVDHALSETWDLDYASETLPNLVSSEDFGYHSLVRQEAHLLTGLPHRTAKVGQQLGLQDCLLPDSNHHQRMLLVSGASCRW